MNDNKSINNSRYVFFDFWDTLVHRKVSSDSIKQIWALEMSKLFPDISAKEIYEIRLLSEKSISKRYSCYNYGQLIQEFIVQLANYKRKCFDWKEVKENALKIEYEVEFSNIYRDDKIYDLITAVLKQNKKIYIVSDFYHDKCFLADLLKDIGYPQFYEDIFVSCEYDVSKAQMGLYDLVMEKLNVQSNEVCMIGDNYRVDYLKAKLIGLNAVHYKHDEYKENKRIKELENLLWKTAKENIANYYETYSFTLFYFIEKLYNKMKKENVKNLFFLAREGKFLKKLFDYYIEMREEYTIKTHYIYVSRRSTYLPSLTNLGDETFDVLFAMPTYSISSFLDNLNYNSDEKNTICDVANKCGVSFDKVIDHFNKSSEFKWLLSCREFIDTYELKRVESKEIIMRYFNQYNVDFEQEGFHLVDVGWKGTIQDNIYKIFDKKIHVSGSYVGLVELTNVVGTNFKEGLLFDETYPMSDNVDIWSSNRLVYEDILHADHPATKAYCISNSEVVPVFDRAEDEILGTISAQLQEDIFTLYKKIIPIFSGTVYTASDLDVVFRKIIVHGIKKCSREDVRRYNLMCNAHYGNFLNFQTIQEVRNNRSFKERILIYLRYFKKINIIFSDMFFLKFSVPLASKGLGGLFWLYREIVYFKEKIKI